ncbi:DUF3349 domain-containing protein [Nostocoides veronense]|uniref:Uncharacterized protein n=1 Tax=Nostocoides veronense TaxID=330836 RepID=A0ABN2LAN2_9MICO
MRPLTPDILHWIRDGFPDGIPDAEAPALFSVLSDRVGAERAGDVLRKLQTEGRLSAEAAAALLPGESAQRQVAAKLALGGWPLGGGSADGGDDEAPPREGMPSVGSSRGCARATPAGCPTTTMSRCSPCWSAA